MKSAQVKLTLMVVLLSFLSLATIAQTAYSLKTHKVSVEGTSSLHDWTSEVSKVDWSGKITLQGNALKAVQDVTVTIAVKSIKSEKGGMMDDKTYEAFKEEK